MCFSVVITQEYRPVKEAMHGYAHFLGKGLAQLTFPKLNARLEGLSIWLLWPVIYLFGMLVKVDS